MNIIKLVMRKQFPKNESYWSVDLPCDLGKKALRIDVLQNTPIH